jgi:hypothetical protein
MKLHELSATQPTKQIAQVIESYFGNNISFDRLNRAQSAAMLRRVKGLLSEHRRSSDIHSSENNPAYLKLVMLEQALQKHIVEYVQSGTGAGQPAKKIVPGQQPQAPVQETKKKRRIREASELQQAQVVLASQDMVDQIQKMLEQVSAMQFKDLAALVDQAKSEVGPVNAAAFQQAATVTLTDLLASLQAARGSMEAAQSSLTGEAPPVDLAAPQPADAGTELPAAPAPVEEPEPELEPAGAALGRARR